LIRGDRSLARAAARLDQELFERAARRPSPLLDLTLPRLSRAADYGVLWMAVAGGLALAGGSRGRRAAGAGLVALGITSALANQLGKRSFSRRRPLLDSVPLGRRARRVPISASFPSGHAASAAAFATAVAVAFPAAALPVAVLATGVAWSRVHTGVHYPGDVLAGVLLGTAVGLLVGRRALRMRRGGGRGGRRRAGTAPPGRPGCW
jgi:membrane-associated phospholipid phosphatase